jgi:hypothetical protein
MFFLLQGWVLPITFTRNARGDKLPTKKTLLATSLMDDSLAGRLGVGNNEPAYAG